MTHKSIIIRPSDDGDDRVDIQLDLCSYYRQIVEGVSENISGGDEFRSQLELIVWGCFYIEAAMNKALNMMIEDSVQGILVPKDVVDSLERSSLKNKITLILDRLGKSGGQTSDLRKSTIGLF